MEKLANEIEEILSLSDGTWGVVVADLDRNERWEWNGDELFYAASVIKVPIMAAVFQAEREGKLSLDDFIPLNERDYVGGSGVIQHFTPGTKMSIRDIVLLMIIQSDNTATNMMIDLVGVEKIQETMKTLGMETSTFYNKLMISAEGRKHFNMLNANDVANLLIGIANREVVSAEASKEMLEIMKKQQIRDCLPEKFPSPYADTYDDHIAWEFANKTGWVPGLRHDAGVLYTNGRRVVISAFSKDEDDLKSKRMLAEIGEAVYRWMHDGES
jgi:beta-lactamase class A